jgi:hypothetical protein
MHGTCTYLAPLIRQQYVAISGSVLTKPRKKQQQRQGNIPTAVVAERFARPILTAQSILPCLPGVYYCHARTMNGDASANGRGQSVRQAARRQCLGSSRQLVGSIYTGLSTVRAVCFLPVVSSGKRRERVLHLSMTHTRTRPGSWNMPVHCWQCNAQALCTALAPVLQSHR